MEAVHQDLFLLEAPVMLVSLELDLPLVFLILLQQAVRLTHLQQLPQNKS
jgi:hypothetical protein